MVAMCLNKDCKTPGEHCRSLISIHILYNHTPAAPLRPHPELCCGLLIFHWTEVVHIEMRTPGAHLKPPRLFEFHEEGCAERVPVFIPSAALAIFLAAALFVRRAPLVARVSSWEMLSMLSLALALAPPVLRFIDCKTGREIVLVGCMHGNPTSIRLTEAVLRECADADELGAVALELCPQRWERTANAPPPPPGSLRAWLRADEVQAAVCLAEEIGCGLIAADQEIDVTCARLAQLSKQTAMQLATPAGWRCARHDLASGYQALQPDAGAGAVGICPLSYVEPRLLVGAPVALLRYLLASPALAGGLLGVGFVLALGVGAAEPPAVGANAPQGLQAVSELLPYIAVALLESLLLLRVSLVGLVEERNYVLARNIRAASMQVLTPPRALRQRGRGMDGRAVVAVLGLAHLNGVRTILTTSRTV